MTNVVAAACLALLTLLRVTAIWNPPARPAFLASAFATAGFTIYIERVYAAFDSILGGRNFAGLLLSLCVTAAFLQLHIAVSSAAQGCTGGRSIRIRGGVQRYKAAWMVCSLAMVAGFGVSDLPVTSQSLLRTYGAQPGMVLFLLAASTFIAFTSLAIIRTVLSHLAEMSKAFRAGFFLVCAGCLTAIILLAARSVIPLVSDPLNANFVNFYGTGQALAVICVAAGLLAPRLVVVGRVIFLDIAARWHLVRIIPLWRAVTERITNVVLDDHQFRTNEIFRAGPYAALQRRVTEIRDCQLLAPEECPAAWRKYEDSLTSAERLMEISRASISYNVQGRTTK